MVRLRDEKRDKWWEDEVGKVTAKLKVSHLYVDKAKITFGSPDLRLEAGFTIGVLEIFRELARELPRNSFIENY